MDRVLSRTEFSCGPTSLTDRVLQRAEFTRIRWSGLDVRQAQDYEVAPVAVSDQMDVTTKVIISQR